MSEEAPTYAVPESWLRSQAAVARAVEVQHVGELALAWAVAQTAWEDAPRGDQRELRRLMLEADKASEHLRAACLVVMVHEAPKETTT
jgi:hypothetical protein